MCLTHTKIVPHSYCPFEKMIAERNFLLGIVHVLANAKPLAAEGI